MNSKGIKIFTVTLLSLFFIACTEPVDFNQAEDLVLEPVVESSIIFYKANAGNFFIAGMEDARVRDSVITDLFNKSFVQSNLVKAEFVFETKNSINRAYALTIEFADVNNRILEAFSVNTPPSPNNEVIATTYTQAYEGEALERVKETQKLYFTLEMLAGDPITQDSPGEIDLKSKGVFYLNID
ncbi:hypothetical protein MHTCC0001_12020 [Flavobacteriaceae bacterium MHTCC 0001]